jgi:tetratricopeptide (TPR) repeat protein
MSENEQEESVKQPNEDQSPTVDSYRESLKSDPNNPVLHYELGLMLKEQGNNESAIEHLTRCADIQKSASETSKAVEAYRHLIQIEPVDPAHRLLLAECHEELEQNEAAVEQYQEASIQFMQQEDFVPSLETIRLALKHDPNNLRDAVRIAESLAALDRKEESAEILARVIAVLKTNGNPKALAPITARLIAIRGDNAELLNDLAAHFLENTEPELAIPCLKKSYEQAPSDTRTLGLLADAFNQLGQTHKTVAVLKKKAALYEDQGLEDERNQALRDILVMNPEETQVKLNLDPNSDGGSEEHQELEITELPDEEIDALIAQIQDAEDEQELGFGSFSIDEEGDPVLPPELGGRKTSSGANSSRVGTEEIRRVSENSVITSVSMQDLKGDTAEGHKKAAASSAEIMALVERFDAQISSEEEREPAGEEIGFAEPSAPVESDTSNTDAAPVEASSPGNVMVDLSTEIEELDFYIESALEDEARELLADLLIRYPEHSELESRRNQLDNA